MDISNIYMLVGFLLAAYSVIANDSIQTLGTFLASNKKRFSWQKLAAATSLVLIITLTYGWVSSGGDLSFGRLESKEIPFAGTFTIWHVLAPLSLVFLTRFGIPVSTTFLVLSVFGTGVFIQKMILKSVAGYAVAFIASFILWILIARYFIKKEPETKKNLKHWITLQWITTGYLWVVWLMQDMANIVVYLPREINLTYFLFVNIVLTLGIFYIFSRQGGKIQNVVASKTSVAFVKSATLIDFVFATILLFFKEINNIPMSTTWVFIGLLAGRELGIHFINGGVRRKLPMIFKDLGKVTLGLVISLAIALGAAYFSG